MGRLFKRATEVFRPTREAKLSKVTSNIMSNLIAYIKFCERKGSSEVLFDSNIVGFERSAREIDVNEEELELIMLEVKRRLKSKGYRLMSVDNSNGNSYEINIKLK